MFTIRLTNGSFQEISKLELKVQTAGQQNERSVTGIMQWMKLTKDLANPSCDFVY